MAVLLYANLNAFGTRMLDGKASFGARLGPLVRHFFDPCHRVSRPLFWEAIAAVNGGPRSAGPPMDDVLGSDRL